MTNLTSMVSQRTSTSMPLACLPLLQELSSACYEPLIISPLAMLTSLRLFNDYLSEVGHL